MNTANFTGSKYETTRNLSIVDVAKLVRADIKAAEKAGKLPKGIKVAVRTQKYSGGCSLDVEIQAAPGLMICNPERVKFDRDFPHGYTKLPLLSEGASAVRDAVEALVSAYNYNDSDTLTDYFSYKFAGSVQFSMEARCADERIQLANMSLAADSSGGQKII